MTTTVSERVREKLDAEIEEARAELAKAKQREAKAHAEHDAARDAEQKLWDAEDSDEPKEASKELAAAWDREEQSFANVMSAIGERQYLQGLLKDLEDPTALDRRIAQGEEHEVRFADLRKRAPAAKSDAPKRLTVPQAAKAVLADADGALHYREICKRMVDGGLWKPKGATPEATVGAALAVQAKREDGEFVRVAPSVYDLKERAA